MGCTVHLLRQWALAQGLVPARRENKLIATDRNVNILLIANRPCRATLFHNTMQQAGVLGLVRRLPPARDAIDCARQYGPYCDTVPPDLIFFDYAVPDKQSTAVLKKIAFGPDKVPIPVIVLTSPVSQTLLDAGDVDGGKAVMFAPTGLASFIRKMRFERRVTFFKALGTLYEFGPILVRTPVAVLNQDARELAISA